MSEDFRMSTTGSRHQQVPPVRSPIRINSANYGAFKFSCNALRCLAGCLPQYPGRGARVGVHRGAGAEARNAGINAGRTLKL